MTLTEALRALHAAGRIRSPWLPGMLLFTSLLDTIRRVDSGWSWGSGAWSPPELTFDGMVNLTDPATVGCLLALLREAVGDPELWVGPSHPQPRAVFHRPEGRWEDWTLGETDGEAIAAALIALAGVP